jgi:hypothetical protein
VDLLAALIGRKSTKILGSRFWSDANADLISIVEQHPRDELARLVGSEILYRDLHSDSIGSRVLLALELRRTRHDANKCSMVDPAALAHGTLWEQAS